MTRLLIILAATAALTAACNTVQGVGEDVAAGGKAISNTAEEVKKDIKKTY